MGSWKISCTLVALWAVARKVGVSLYPVNEATRASGSMGWREVFLRERLAVRV
jgi:hypothetical protein